PSEGRRESRYESASASREWSENVWPTKVIPKGNPSTRNPAGAATPARSNKFRKFVNTPSRLFSVTGSHSTSEIRKISGAVGNNRKSATFQVSDADCRNRSNAYWPLKASTAEYFSPPRIISGTTGGTASAC